MCRENVSYLHIKIMENDFLIKKFACVNLFSIDDCVLGSFGVE